MLARAYRLLVARSLARRGWHRRLAPTAPGGAQAVASSAPRATAVPQGALHVAG